MNSRNRLATYKRISAIALSLIVLAFDVGASELTSIFGGIRTRTTCLENVKGLGNASIVFAAPIDKTYKEDNSMNEEFLWDAYLVTSSGKDVPVRLHCTRLKLGAMPEKGIDKPWIAYMAEIVKR